MDKMIKLGELITGEEAKDLRAYVARRRKQLLNRISVHQCVMSWLEQEKLGKECKAKLEARKDIHIPYAAYVFEYYLQLQ